MFDNQCLLTVLHVQRRMGGWLPATSPNNPFLRRAPLHAQPLASWPNAPTAFWKQGMSFLLSWPFLQHRLKPVHRHALTDARLQHTRSHICYLVGAYHDLVTHPGMLAAGQTRGWQCPYSGHAAVFCYIQLSRRLVKQEHGSAHTVGHKVAMQQRVFC